MSRRRRARFRALARGAASVVVLAPRIQSRQRRDISTYWKRPQLLLESFSARPKGHIGINSKESSVTPLMISLLKSIDQQLPRVIDIEESILSQYTLSHVIQTDITIFRRYGVLIYNAWQPFIDQVNGELRPAIPAWLMGSPSLDMDASLGLEWEAALKEFIAVHYSWRRGKSLGDDIYLRYGRVWPYARTPYDRMILKIFLDRLKRLQQDARDGGLSELEPRMLDYILEASLLMQLEVSLHLLEVTDA